MGFSRRLIPLACILFAAPSTEPRPPQSEETWTEWLKVPLGFRVPRDGVGWLRPPYGRESRADLLPVPEILMTDRPCVGGKLLIRRGGVIEAWDLESRRPAWKLPSEAGFIGWTLSGLRVSEVLPGGPADRAGIVEGDRIVGVDGRRFEWESWYEAKCRAGDKIVLDLESTGGERRVTVTADRSPEPFGTRPTVAAPIGDDLLLERDGAVERLRLSDGRLLWSVKGDFMAAGTDRVLIGNDENVSACDATSGARLWTVREGPAGRVSAVWSDEGPVLCGRQDSGATIKRLNPSTGAVAWSFSNDRQVRPFMQLMSHGRVYFRTYDTECSTLSPMGGYSTCSGPTCMTFDVLDLKTGARLWTRRTGGRTHGGSSRHELLEHIPFDPLLGGPGCVAGDRLLWFDVRKETLSIFDPATLREERTISIVGAQRFGDFAPPGCVSVEGKTWTNWVDVALGTPHRVDWVSGWNSMSSISANLALVVGPGDDDKTGTLIAYDWTSEPPKLVWKAVIPQGWGGLISGRQARTCVTLRNLSGAEGSWLGLFETPTGKAVFSEKIPRSVFWYCRGSGQYIGYGVLADPYLLIVTIEGLRVLRRK